LGTVFELSGIFAFSSLTKLDWL